MRVQYFLLFYPGPAAGRLLDKIKKEIFVSFAEPVNRAYEFGW